MADNGKPTNGKRLAAWQPGKGRVDLDKFDSDATPYSVGDKTRDKIEVDSLAQQIDALQNLLYANRARKLLVVLQGLDTAGKDGTIRDVFNRTSPLGVHAVGWKAPTEDERAHDYLWRIHRCVPAAGEIVVFNRSHYEDVLVPVVNGWITPEQQRQRFEHINDFERMLAETGTVICKFMLHIGYGEQRARLQERLDDPAKNWKFNPGDLDVRKQWPQYQRAYEDLLGATHTAWAPWTIVPADSKTHRNLMVATVVRDTLAGLDLCPPPANPALRGVQVD
ncbi:polyphosphate--nucleotide phosphotransferase [Ramlibacter sp. H39-3-26]|uniref:PPK2 family polyphosphate kinase n=1 Tax=Curvibacter soli TaxID=3031331 RepID=UPI0023DB5836|nr:PPK2 family polyphosphate kinase [Ramlibacter sp. H39-3-26]MDF1484308.1 polyphosphate--nucleotide phosphotransferase [Ramlibacter sp. H39-3-26]